MVAELITQSPRPEICDGATLRSILPRPHAATVGIRTLRESAQLSPQPKIGLVEEHQSVEAHRPAVSDVDDSRTG